MKMRHCGLSGLNEAIKEALLQLKAKLIDFLAFHIFSKEKYNYIIRGKCYTVLVPENYSYHTCIISYLYVSNTSYTLIL